MVLCIGFEPLITRSNQITAGSFSFTAVFLWGCDAPRHRGDLSASSPAAKISGTPS